MSKNRVTYDKKMRDKAIAEKRGLFTVDLISASKSDGKLGSRVTMQGPVDADDYKDIWKFMLSSMKKRSLAKAQGKQP